MVKEARAAPIPERFDVRRMLVNIGKLDVDACEAIGNGTELRFSMKGLHGSALLAKDRLLRMVMLRNE